MTFLRDPTLDDIASATRGLGLMRLTTAELGELYICHLPIQTFASQVIASAAHILIERRTQEDKP
jgi:hypothetical protein